MSQLRDQAECVEQPVALQGHQSPDAPYEPAARRPRRLISLREACLRRGISVRSYWRDTSLLPRPIKGKGKHLFLEEEVDILISRLLMSRST